MPPTVPQRFSPTPASRTLRVTYLYALMVVATVALYFVIRYLGGGLSAAPAPAVGAPAPNPGTGTVVMFHVLLALSVVIVAARGLGTLFRRIHQPPVVGEILAGILLGPSLLGRLLPHASAYLLPPEVAPFLQVLSQVGVILYMFLVGLELDPALLRKRGHSTIAISHASIAVPFLLGAGLALALYPRLSFSDVSFTNFSLFLGVSMSVTAFPVLARILTDRRIHKTRMGAIALTCAAIDDITAWCLLALVVSVVDASRSGAFKTVALALVYVAAMLLVVRPLLNRVVLIYGNRGRITQGLMAFMFVLLLLSSVATELIGIHAIFGAFALGAIVPHDSGLARELTDRLEDLVVVLLLPPFFAFTGLRTQIGLVSGAEQWLLCLAIIAVASAGKFGGSFVAARLTGLEARDSAALGVLMNTRGLMELIVLNIGLDFGVISPPLFAMLVLMALVTTIATTPILHFIRPGQSLEREDKESALASPTAGILVPVANPGTLHRLIDLAVAASRPGEAPPHVLALAPMPPGGVRSGLREVEQRVAPPRASLLSSALDYARDQGAEVVPESIWSDNPACDILEAARQLRSAWVLLGAHRPVFGTDFLGGVVRDVLTGTRDTATRVAVVVGDHHGALNQVFVLVDHGADSQAALELALRLGQSSRASVHAILLADQGEPPAELLETVRRVGRASGRWLYTDVLTRRDPEALLRKGAGPLIAGMALIQELGLVRSDSLDHRCVIAVQGGREDRTLEQAAEQRRASG